MKYLWRILAIVIAGVAGLLLLPWIASESGEVVVLSSQAASGEIVETRLWVVDLHGGSWLRAGMPDSGWYKRLVASPRVTVTRDDTTSTYLAVPTVDRRSDVNLLMREKYGWADAVISLMFGRGDAIPVHLTAPD